MQKMVLSILIDNTPGALSRVVGLFSRRGYNIDSLTVGETENTEVSRMTVAVTGDGIVLEQIEKQIHKLENVIDVEKLTSDIINVNIWFINMSVIKKYTSNAIDIILIHNIFNWNFFAFTIIFITSIVLCFTCFRKVIF